mmetsp:Transcript_18000/g.69690  ORF Transcript_18000/g.69690 Transcript_18000/m.69690 type:complete len:235 (-) Transcript_18000:522-1226(-)
MGGLEQHVALRGLLAAAPRSLLPLLLGECHLQCLAEGHLAEEAAAPRLLHLELRHSAPVVALLDLHPPAQLLHERHHVLLLLPVRTRHRSPAGQHVVVVREEVGEGGEEGGVVREQCASAARTHVSARDGLPVLWLLDVKLLGHPLKECHPVLALLPEALAHLLPPELVKLLLGVGVTQRLQEGAIAALQDPACARELHDLGGSNRFPFFGCFDAELRRQAVKELPSVSSIAPV